MNLKNRVTDLQNEWLNFSRLQVRMNLPPVKRYCGTMPFRSVGNRMLATRTVLQGASVGHEGLREVTEH